MRSACELLSAMLLCGCASLTRSDFAYFEVLFQSQSPNSERCAGGPDGLCRAQVLETAGANAGVKFGCMPALNSIAALPDPQLQLVRASPLVMKPSRTAGACACLNAQEWALVQDACGPLANVPEIKGNAVLVSETGCMYARKSAYVCGC